MKLSILGGGISGISAAMLAKKNGYDVFVSDNGVIQDQYKSQLRALDIPFEENGHSIDKLLSADLIVKSPGISNTSTLIQTLKGKGKEIIGDIEFAYKFNTANLIGITGSNGKTTTTSLVFHIMKEAGLKVAMGGNIGIPFSDILLEEDTYNWIVLELSSFQLEDVTTFKPFVAIQLNITPDHLDRYEYDIENYAQAKFKLHKSQDEDCYWIYNGEDAFLVKEAAQVNAKTMTTPFQGATDQLHKEFNVDVDAMHLKGLHNHFNALVAAKAAQISGVSSEIIKHAIESFHAIPHRLENVGVVNGVTYINDSKATNTDAVKYALMSMDNPTIWIVGGVDKGNDYNSLKSIIEEKIKAVVFLGIDNSKLISFFETTTIPFCESDSMAKAIEASKSFAQAGDYVLLSPACASFDLFKNYIDRGDQFRNIVNELIQES